MWAVNINYGTPDYYYRARTDISGGPTRIMVEDEEDKDFTSNPVGFVWNRPVEKEPMTWDGDNA